MTMQHRLIKILVLAIACRVEAQAPRKFTFETVKLKQHHQGAPDRDGILSWTPSDAFIGGKLVYTLSQPENGNYGRLRHFIVVREVGKEPKQDNISTYALTQGYPWATVNSPLLSPSGKRVFFRHDSEEILLDAASHTLDLTASSLLRASLTQMPLLGVSWSPDSRFIATTQGRLLGGEWDSDIPLKVFDVNTEINRTLLPNHHSTLVWTKANRLLHEWIPPTWGRQYSKSPSTRTARQPIKIAGELPGIWSMDADGKNRRLVISFANSAQLSPDEQWILFIGSKYSGGKTWTPLREDFLPPDGNDDSWWEDDSDEKYSFYLYQRATKKITRLPANPLWVQQWRWSADSKKLIGLRSFYKQAGFALIEIDIKTRLRRLVASVKEAAVEFKMPALSADGRYAYITIKNFHSLQIEGNHVNTTRYQLKAIDISNGEVFTLTELDATGLDWMPAPIQK